MQVYAYSVAFGRELGSWAAHDDTVACLHLLPEDRLITASWDCSVKIWRSALPLSADQSAWLPYCACSMKSNPVGEGWDEKQAGTGPELGRPMSCHTRPALHKCGAAVVFASQCSGSGFV